MVEAPALPAGEPGGDDAADAEAAEADGAAADGAGPDGAGADAEAADDAARNKLYKQTAAGLEVTIDGVVFLVNVSAKKVGAGWGVVLTAEVESEGAERFLLGSDAGPFAFAARVTAGETELLRQGDERTGSNEQRIAADGAVKLERAWPPKGTAAVKPGQELVLEVGLWGLGRRSGETLPVKKFLVVKMVAPRGRPAKAYVQPPE